MSSQVSNIPNRISSPSNSPAGPAPSLSPPMDKTPPKSLIATPPSPLSPKNSKLLASSLKVEKKEVSETVEAILMSYGYFPISKFFDTTNDEGIILYIKCRNRYGETVYVDMDDIDFASEDETAIFVRQGKLKEIPLAIKVGDLECVDDIVCGLAYDCKDGFCVVKGSKDKTDSYVYKEEFKSRSLSGSDGIPHPVISMKEIKSDPTNTLKMTHKAVERIRNKVEEDSRRRIEESKESVKNFMTAYSEFIAYVQTLEQGYNKTIETLQSFSDGNYAIMLSKDKESQEYKDALRKQRKISSEIYLRGQKLQELIVTSRNLSERLSSMKDNAAYLKEQTEKLKELTNKINSTFEKTEEIGTK
jgi:hypothetical protein